MSSAKRGGSAAASGGSGRSARKGGDASAALSASSSARGVSMGEGGVGVESDSHDERIRTRRARIRQRMEAARRREQGLAEEEKGDQGNPALNPDPVQSNSRIADAYKNIDLVQEQGMEKVTLVRVAADFAEAKRRRAEESSRAERRDKLWQLRDETVDMFQRVSSKWDQAAAKVDVLELDKALKEQREACDAIVQRKDDVLREMQTALKAKDDDYVRNLRAQAADVDTIIAYMDDQITTLSKEYRKELDMIEETFMRERQQLLDETRREWEDAMKMRREKELKAIEESRGRIEEQERQLEHLRINDAEEYSQIKRRLEQDIMNMQQELQNMRATYQLNTEKLEYNYQVLKKRDEENTVTISSQKRRLNKLADAVNNLRAKLKKQELQIQSENVSLTEEYTRVTSQFQDLQRKAKHFDRLNQKRIDEVWTLNEEQCVASAKELLSADRVIHEQQLGLQWVPPLDAVMDSTLSEEELKSRKASAVAQELLDGEDFNDVEAGHIMPSSMRHILSHICDEAGFLVESKLVHLLDPLNPKEQMLIKLDAIFKALQVETEDDMKKLMTYFVAHADDSETKDGVPTLVKAEHVPAALRRFVEDQRKAKGLDESLRPARGLKNRNPEFWRRLVDTVPDAHDKTYAALTDGLEKYKEALTGREKAMARRDELTQQNNELRSLLKGYMSSNVNAQLEIPPTAVLRNQIQQHQLQSTSQRGQSTAAKHKAQ